MMGISSGSQSPDDESGDVSAPQLDPTANQIMNLVARIMIRCGYDSEALQEAFDQALTAHAASVLPLPPSAVRELPEAPHVITLWTSLEGYRDEKNNPLPLPLRGRGRSIQQLARLVSPNLDVEELLRYLLQTETVRKVGRRYVLARRWIMLRGVAGSAHSRTMRGLVGALRTYDHNLLAPSDAESWFEFTVDNPNFPVSKLGELDQRARRLGLGKFRELDLFMRHCETHRDPLESTVWVGFQIHEFLHNFSAVLAPVPTEASPPQTGPPDKHKP
ncbi:MAG: hypothetical protein JSR36_00725 [Proteobacteria bacterium]|nr:hypothetical protein [Pseudomonadota bacterium]